jgi:integrase
VLAVSDFISKLAPLIDAMIDYKEALGFSRQTHMSSLRNFDRYCAEYAPDTDTVCKDTVLSWLHRELEKPRSGISKKAMAVRLLGKYICATGRDAYVLPDGYVVEKSTFTPYIFTDAELKALFGAIDNLPAEGGDNTALIMPVMFRLIYTCGLRPNEGRELKRVNINLDTGEVFVTKTKRKKERIVVMSDDMLAYCRKYDKQRAAFGGGEFFFPCRNHAAYTERRAGAILNRCWEMANPDVNPDELPNIRIYDLRHRFASATLNRWLDEGRNLYVMLPYLCAYMGHANMSETAYYIHILPENLVQSAGVDWAALNAVIPEVSVWQK